MWDYSKSQKNLMWCVACLGMVASHSAMIVLFPHGWTWVGVALRVFARSTSVFWPMMIGLGAAYTHDRCRYLGRVLVIAGMAELPYAYVFPGYHNDVLALAVGLGLTWVVDRGWFWLCLVVSVCAVWGCAMNALYVIGPWMVYALREYDGMRDWLLMMTVAGCAAVSGGWLNWIYLVGLVVWRDVPGLGWRPPVWLRYGFFPGHYMGFAGLRLFGWV